MSDETETEETPTEETPEFEEFEDEAPAEPEPEPEPEPETPEDAVLRLEAENADLNDKLLRAMAETENVRRRAERDREDASKYAIAGFAREMLSVGDNLNRALGSIDADARKDDENLENLAVGVEMTEREMLAAFERAGVKPIEAEGQRFDHNFHEAMFEIEDPNQPAGTVMQVIEKGYVLGERLLRPSRVGVSKGGPKPEAPEPPREDKADTKAGTQAYESAGGPAGSNLNEEL